MLPKCGVEPVAFCLLVQNTCHFLFQADVKQNRISMQHKLIVQFPALYGTCKFITMFKSLPLDPILSQMGLVHIVQLCFCNIHFNMMLLLMSKPPKWGLP